VALDDATAKTALGASVIKAKVTAFKVKRVIDVTRGPGARSGPGQGAAGTRNRPPRHRQAARQLGAGQQDPSAIAAKATRRESVRARIRAGRTSSEVEAEGYLLSGELRYRSLRKI
jgi:hypothetical protein